MRVLCLHGAGTSADIFKLQTERFRALLPSDFEYAWVDGEIETDAAPGVEEVFPGPYLSFYDLCTTDQLADAHAQCKEVLEEEGPFDAVMGFSQVKLCPRRPRRGAAGNTADLRLGSSSGRVDDIPPSV